MNKKITVKIVLGAITLLFLFIGLYSFSKLTAKEKGSETNLYSLVPPSATAVLQINDLNNLILDLGKLNFRHHYPALQISEFITFMKDNVDLVNASKAHGLSPQMNRMMLSFHPPYSTKDQILYCRLGSQDQSLVEKIIKENSSTLFTPKTFIYKNEEIHIYPLDNNEFLACYFQPGFFVASYQKRLVEKIIDTKLSRHSLLTDTVFTALYNSKKNQSPLTLYLKTNPIPLGEKKKHPLTAPLAEWTELDFKLNRNAIYLTGRCLDTDNNFSFEKVLKAQKSVESVSGKKFPVSTHFFYQLAASDLSSIFAYSRANRNISEPLNSTVYQNDSILTRYLTEHTAEEINYLMFHDDNSSASVRKLLRFQFEKMENPETEKEQLLGTLYKKIYLNQRVYSLYKLPPNSIFAQFTGKPGYKGDVYGCFYESDLLVAPNDSSIYSYIRQIEEELIENNKTYKECLSSIAPESNYLFLCDLNEAIFHADSYEQLIPRFFFTHKEFFQYFILTCQFTYANGKIYPYVVFTYKE